MKSNFRDGVVQGGPLRYCSSQNFGCRISAALSPNLKEERVILAFEDGGLSIFRMVKSRGIILEKSSRQYAEQITALEIRKEQGKQKLVFSAYGGIYNSIVVHSYPELKPLKEMLGHEAEITSLTLLQSNYLLSCSVDCSLIIWDLDQFTGMASLELEEGQILCSAYDRETKTVLVGREDSKVCVCILEFNQENDLIDNFRLLRTLKTSGSVSHIEVLEMDRFVAFENPHAFVYDTRGIRYRKISFSNFPTQISKLDHQVILIANGEMEAPEVLSVPFLLKRQNLTEINDHDNSDFLRGTMQKNWLQKF